MLTKLKGQRFSWAEVHFLNIEKLKETIPQILIVSGRHT
ncbi:uncharacterized protein METZ01_LOCUS512762 [marine metagenome]|uniref:Uncharacterized protein n=1 Tax=marine metagenome TaxID=408172 RepID=A0A383EUZ3_9ZZZZ